MVAEGLDRIPENREADRAEPKYSPPIRQEASDGGIDVAVSAVGEALYNAISVKS